MYASDSKNCRSSESDIIVSGPTGTLKWFLDNFLYSLSLAISLDVSQRAATCSNAMNGQITLTAHGGNGGYTYKVPF